MRFDCHMHTRPFTQYGDMQRFDRQAFLEDLHTAGFDGAAVYSLSPNMFADYTVEQRMDAALTVCEGQKTLFPFFWIDPMDEQAEKQVELAVQKGFSAFKMSGILYNPACERSLAIIEQIAATGKPIMFHSGICWDAENSAANHRPMNFEAMLKIPNLRFCLAHVSWPWYDECIAVYGKIRNAFVSKRRSCEMFIDVTPGTPKIYREEVFRKLLGCYDMRKNLMFGTDCNTAKYDVLKSKTWQDTDNALYEKYVQHDVEDFKDHVYGLNLLRFLGISESDCM